MNSPTLEHVISLALQLTLAEQAQLIEQVAAWMGRELNESRSIEPTEPELGVDRAVPHDRSIRANPIVLKAMKRFNRRTRI